jgi:hypothetical protein
VVYNKKYAKLINLFCADRQFYVPLFCAAQNAPISILPHADVCGHSSKKNTAKCFLFTFTKNVTKLLTDNNLQIALTYFFGKYFEL